MLPQSEKGLRQVIEETLGEEVGLTGNQFWILSTMAMFVGYRISQAGGGLLQVIGFGFAGVGINVWLQLIREVVSE